MRMNIFRRLDTDIIHTHILPRLDGTTLTVLSSVCSELRHMICNNEDLWRNMCTSTWPSLLLDPIVNNVISTFPGGYRSFFSFNLHSNNSYSWYSSGELIHAIDIYIHGEPLLSRVLVGCLTTENPTLIYDSLGPTIHIPLMEGWFDYLKENLMLSWILIDPTRKCAVDLFQSCRKPFRFRGLVSRDGNMIVFGIGMTGKGQERTEMNNCELMVSFDCKGGSRLQLRRAVIVNCNADILP